MELLIREIEAFGNLSDVVMESKAELAKAFHAVGQIQRADVELGEIKKAALRRESP